MISANRTTQPSPVLPLGACLVAQSARRAGHDVYMLDLMFSRAPRSDLAGELREFKPDVVGLSVRNIDTNDIANPVTLSEEAADLVGVIRAHSRAKVVLGGAAVGVMPDALLACTGADWAVRAYGEWVFPKLLAAIAGGADVSAVPGVMSPGGAELPLPLRPELDDDSLLEDFARWVDLRAYLRRMATVPLQAKRGCPFRCVYCTYARAEGRDYRLHAPRRVVDWIATLAKRGVRDIEFVDNVFNSPYEHAMEICRLLAGASLPARLQTLELNPRFLDDALLSAMEAAGFVGIGVTAESAADSVLAALQKDYLAADVQRAAETVARHRLPCIWMFMLGGPRETRETVEQTLHFAATVVRPADAVLLQVGTRIYPGTPLEQIARLHGLLRGSTGFQPVEAGQDRLNLDPTGMLRPVFYVSPQTPLAWLQSKVAATTAEHPNFIAVDSMALPLLQSVMRLAYRLGLRPPMWRYTRSVRRILGTLGLYRPASS